MKIIDKASYKELVLECRHIEGYTRKCNNCGNQIETVNNVKIEECPTCKSKNISKAIAKRCPNVERIAYTIQKGIDNHLKSIDKRKLKNWNKPDEYYCNKHAQETTRSRINDR